MLKSCKSDLVKVFGLAENIIINLNEEEDTHSILKEILKEIMKHALNDVGLKIGKLIVDNRMNHFGESVKQEFLQDL